jgi:hypothetical protein
MTLRIANAAGFLGDRTAAPRELVQRAEVDYLTLEYLAELTLSILARQRQKDPRTGYAADFLEVIESLCPAIYLQSQLSIITNAGGMNPRACAAAAGKLLRDNGSPEAPLAVVTGDDLIDKIDELLHEGCPLAHLETGQPLADLKLPIVSANAYLGSEPITAALRDGGRVVITGRVADASLTVAPARFEYDWAGDDWSRLAGASVAGHLIECGAQVTGGYSLDWREASLGNVGYPIAEVADDGSCVITKPSGTGGQVTRRTVIEQMVYEIGDPAAYLTPDVAVDFTTVEVEDQGSDRVAVRGATGRPAPNDYKVSLAYHYGYTASAQLLVYGTDCVAKANAAADMVFARVKSAGYELGETLVELLGANHGVPGLHKPSRAQREVVLRMTVRDPRRDAVERFTKEVAPLITSGPAGLAGYAAGRSRVRPVYAYWPALIPKDRVEVRIETKAAKHWAAER